jgi:hypothetical protein
MNDRKERMHEALATMAFENGHDSALATVRHVAEDAIENGQNVVGMDLRQATSAAWLGGFLDGLAFARRDPAVAQRYTDLFVGLGGGFGPDYLATQREEQDRLIAAAGELA